MKEEICKLIFKKEFDKAKIKIQEINFDLNFINELGRSPLLLATGTDNVEFIEYLLSKGADPNYNEAYILPISNAIENAAFKLDYSRGEILDKRIIETLYKYGAKVDIKDKFGETPLDFLGRYFGYDNIEDFLKNEQKKNYQKTYLAKNYKENRKNLKQNNIAIFGKERQQKSSFLADEETEKKNFSAESSTLKEVNEDDKYSDLIKSYLNEDNISKQDNESDISQDDPPRPKNRPPGTSFSVLDEED